MTAIRGATPVQSAFRFGLALLAFLLLPAEVAAQLPDPPCNPVTDPCCRYEIDNTETAVSAAGNMELSVLCGVPLRSVREAAFTVRNLDNIFYKVRVRFEVVCPPDPGGDPVCYCDKGYFDWFDDSLHECDETPCPEVTVPTHGDATPYPKQFLEGADCQLDGEWVWCERELRPAGSPAGKDVWAFRSGVLNTCCDCDLVRKNISCGQVQVTAKKNQMNDPWIPVSDPDLSPPVVECRVAGFGHDVQGVEFTCFEPRGAACPELSAELWARPKKDSCDDSPVLLFSSNEPDPDLRCRFGAGSKLSGPWDLCENVLPVGPLSNGTYTFEVWDDSPEPATDPPTADAYTWSLTANPQCESDTSFRLLKTIHGSSAKNLVSLPMDSTYEQPGGLTRLCELFGLSPDASITQTVNGQINTFLCSQAGVETFQLDDTRGIDVREPEAGTKTGFLVGAEEDGKVITINDYSQGDTIFPVAYHTTATTPEDLCVQCGLSSQADVIRFDAATGLIHTHQCGSLPIWNLERGEAVVIREPNGPKDCVQQTY